MGLGFSATAGAVFTLLLAVDKSTRGIALRLAEGVTGGEGERLSSYPPLPKQRKTAVTSETARIHGVSSLENSPHHVNMSMTSKNPLRPGFSSFVQSICFDGRMLVGASNLYVRSSGCSEAHQVQNSAIYALADRSRGGWSFSGRWDLLHQLTSSGGFAILLESI